MKKGHEKTIFVCEACGYKMPKWMGRCPGCGEWDSVVEEKQKPSVLKKKASDISKPEPLTSISTQERPRIKTQIDEFDRILGGGIVQGSMVLLGGDPGIGKSTIVLQVMGRLSEGGYRCLYVSGEESPRQIKMRADRLRINTPHLHIISETCMEHIISICEDFRPDFIVIDSIQTMFTESLPSTPGSIGQIRDVTSMLLQWVKKHGVSCFLVGHVTKEGAIAGPRVLEHLVDTVLYFEGEKHSVFRILRAVKNRFGSTNEIGVFHMTQDGLKEVKNPSSIFLRERPHSSPGSAIVPCIEGTRPVLVEIQALVSTTTLGMPRRTAMGIDHNRISLLVAVISRKVGLEMADQDIYVNVAGGLRVYEPAADLGIAGAMISSFLDKPTIEDTIMFGEIGLAGEIRGVDQPETRLKEAIKLGFKRCILSKGNLEPCKHINGAELIGISSISELIDYLL